MKAKHTTKSFAWSCFRAVGAWKQASLSLVEFGKAMERAVSPKHRKRRA